MSRIDLNADLGESFGPWRMGQDAEMLDIVTSANVACGFHAGDPVEMQRVVRLCRDKGVGIGAHPGFADLQGFGRRRILDIAAGELAALITYQIGALQAIAGAAERPHAELTLEIVSQARQADAVLITVDLALSCPAGFEKTNAELVAVLAQGFAEVAVPRGENEGRRLRHASIARGWQELTQIPASECNHSDRRSLRFQNAAPIGAGEPAWDLVVFAQQTTDRSIIASGRAELAL